MENELLFPRIPVLSGDHFTENALEDFGDGYLMKQYNGVNEKDYADYLAALEKEGFEKYCDNGDGIGETVFSSTYTKGLWQVTVLFLARPGRICVSVSFGKDLSFRMLPCKADCIPGAKTRLHMIELWWFGNSFVIQLKNGHFLISDGGQRGDSLYLLDYLEALTPDGEKPVVEGWFITHAHGDHCGCLCDLLGEKGQRIAVEGVYYSICGEEIYRKAQNTRTDTANILRAVKGLKNADGEPTRFFRPQTGQKYYFSDLVIEVVHTQEQLPRDIATGDINESSTWLMLRAEGQKCLLTGDGERGCMTALMENYTEEYLNVELMTLMHHGFNTMDAFTDYCKVKTLLQTVYGDTPVRQANENNYLRSCVEEYFGWGDGTKIITFPYSVGEVETVPPKKWIYHNPADRKEQINIRRYFKGAYKKEIRGIRITDNGLVKAGAYLYDRIHAHLPLPTVPDGVMLNLRIEPELKAEKGFLCFVQDPIGWVVTAPDEEKLYEAVSFFVDEATWTEKGFTPIQIKE